MQRQHPSAAAANDARVSQNISTVIARSPCDEAIQPACASLDRSARNDGEGLAEMRWTVSKSLTRSAVWDRMQDIRGRTFMSPDLLSAVLSGGIVAGILDIGAAAAINRVGPVAILRVIASGLLGPKALKGGTLVAGLGFLLQLAMSIVIAAIYGLASLWLPILASMWTAGGLAYGVGVFVVMTYVVVPLSAAPSRPAPGIAKIAKDLLAMLGFGLIVAYAVHRASV
jgi:hypothetical protein